MNTTEHQGKSLQYLTIEPDGYRPEVDYPLVILLHGFGAHMRDLAGLCPSIDREGYIYACPNAPMPFQLGPGMVGYGWTPPRGAGTPEHIQGAVSALDTFFDEVMEKYGVPAGRVILMGFSQGGSMTYRCGLPRPETFAGLAALSSVMPDPEELTGNLPDQRTQPIFIAHGIHDDLAPVERAREAKALLEGLGYRPQYREYAMRHEISQEMLEDLSPWVKSVLSPAST
jgi:phospholipase/carboxylesterase